MSYGISIEAWIKYQRDHIDRVEHTDEAASGDSRHDTQCELFTEEEQLELFTEEEQLTLLSVGEPPLLTGA